MTEIIIGCETCQHESCRIIDQPCRSCQDAPGDDFPGWEPIRVQAAESDPTGRDQHQPGAKLDAGKLRAGLVLGGFARALLAVSAVGTYGATKYTPGGWISVPDGISRYTDAMHRHLLAEAAGQQRDADTDLLHAAHAAWNALARLDLMLREQEQS